MNPRSRTSDFDELLGLRVGADDYVTKPFNPQVLLARIQNLLARTAAPEAGAVLTHKGLTLYVLQAKMRCGDKEAELTRNELGILRLLMRSKGNVIPRDAIIDELWQSDRYSRLQKPPCCYQNSKKERPHSLKGCKGVLFGADEGI